LPRPRGVLHRLRHARADALDPHLRPPPRAPPPQGHRQGRGLHAAPAPGHRDRALHRGHDHLRHGGRHLRHVQLLDGAAAHDPRPLRGIQPHQPDRVLLQGDPGAHEERRRRARLLQPRARELPQRLPDDDRAPDHGGRAELAGAGPQQGQARPLLLDDRRHRRLQLRLLHDLRQVVQVQGDQGCLMQFG
uniref:Uncharacterized protein n=1 Tax=Aegilops tauschii subsp. strangulata TaxID=200361 RepID=A0A453H389_AEGTS